MRGVNLKYDPFSNQNKMSSCKSQLGFWTIFQYMVVILIQTLRDMTEHWHSRQYSVVLSVSKGSNHLEDNYGAFEYCIDLPYITNSMTMNEC